MTALEGGCFCGAVRYRVGGDFGVTHCHCIHCRKLGGAPFVTWVEATREGFAWTRGQPIEFSTREGVSRTYCAGCGSPLTYRNHSHPDSVDVTAGTPQIDSKPPSLGAGQCDGACRRTTLAR